MVVTIATAYLTSATKIAVKRTPSFGQKWPKVQSIAGRICIGIGIDPGPDGARPDLGKSRFGGEKKTEKGGKKLFSLSGLLGNNSVTPAVAEFGWFSRKTSYARKHLSPAAVARRSSRYIHTGPPLPAEGVTRSQTQFQGAGRNWQITWK